MTVSPADVINQVLSLQARNDERIENIFDTIDSETEVLYDSDSSNDSKYNSIVSIEYLLVRARLQVEFEHLKVKNILSSGDTPAAVKPIFIKRDTYLSQVSLKLNNIRDDIANLQKVVYTQKSMNTYLK